jgi:hypothetical protein
MSAEPLAPAGFAPVRASLVEFARRLILLTEFWGSWWEGQMLLGSTLVAICSIDRAVDALIFNFDPDDPEIGLA